MIQIEHLKHLYKMYLEKRQHEDKVFEGLTYYLHKSIYVLLDFVICLENK